MTEVSGTPSRKCSLCDDTGAKDYAGFGMDPCDHDTAGLVKMLRTATMPNGRNMSSGEMASAMCKAATTITRMDAPAEERPTAQDYRNRAERAEAECAELREAALVWVTPRSLTDRPEKPGKASYEYVECLVLHRGQIKLRPWNCEHLVFDDEEQDDHFCEWHEVSMYAVLPTVSIERASA